MIGACETLRVDLPISSVFRVAVVSWDLLFHTQERGRNCLQEGGRALREAALQSGEGFLPSLLKFLGYHWQEMGIGRSFFSDSAHGDRAASQQEPQIITVVLFLLLSYIFGLKRVI